MLHGIDISNWQGGLQIPDAADFVIAKATEGLRFVDHCCDGFIQQAIKKGKLFGFYHFARNNEPEAEACFFADNTVGYRNKGIPVLDIEDESIKNWGNYARRFVDKYHAITGVYPLVYCSAAYLSRFDGYNLDSDCGLWLAGYPDSRAHVLGEVPKLPYGIAPWNILAIWQYTSSGAIDGWDDWVDLDVAYMNREQWMLYATGGNSDELGSTQVMPNPATKQWHFEDGGLKVDISLA